MRRRPGALATLLTAGFLSVQTPGAFASCPQGQVQFNGDTPIPAPGPVFEVVVDPTRAARFDVPAGRLELLANGKFANHVRVVDLFEVVGVPPGTPVLLVVELAVEGEVSSPGCAGSGCWGGISGRISHAAGLATDGRSENVFSGSRPVTFSLALPVAIVAGTPVTIEFELSATGSADHRESGLATFRFDGLPAGASIVSCHGFVGTPTPAMPASWGRVKAVYR